MEKHITHCENRRAWLAELSFLRGLRGRLEVHTKIRARRALAARYAALVLSSSLLTSGCFVHHLDKNAPGIEDISKQPQGLSPGDLKYPEDPGEHVLSLLTGPFFLVGGARAAQFEQWAALYQLGLEATVSYSAREISHRSSSDNTSPFSLQRSELIIGSLSPGVNFGWSPLHWGDGARGRDGHQFYAEAQLRSPIPVVAAGWAIQPDTGQHGPQLTISPFGMNWFRLNYFTNGDFALFYGITLKTANIWVWSQ